MITQKQVQVLKTIDTYIKEKGYSPTVREIGDILDLKSSSTVQSHLDNLEKLGCISRAGSNARTLCVTDKGKHLVKTLL